MKQAQVEAVMAAFFLVIVIALAVLGTYGVKFGLKELREDNDELHVVFIFVMSIMVILVIPLALCINLDTLVTCIVNPEFYALETLTDMLKAQAN